LRKISILPIGTCRINTPLKRGMARYPVQLDLQRIYGFVHTSDEALQQLRYRLGELTFPSDILPILFRPGLVFDNKPVPDRPADLTIIEISSAKSYTIGDVAVQGNYLSRYFSDFFASVPRTRTYWDLAGRSDHAALRAFLESEPTYRLYSETDRSLLARMRVRQQTFDDVRADMAQMVDRLGQERVLFVTHVNAHTPDGSVIASRDKLISWVKRAAQDLRVDCFDPTDLMNTFGQARALERDGLDLTHFSNPFCDRWYATVQREYVLKSLGDGAIDVEIAGQLDAAILTESIAAAIAHDDFFDGTHQLFAAIKAHPENVALQLLHGQVLARIGDFDSALRVLAPFVAAPEMTAELRQALMRALLETGDPGGALALANQMLTDEYENVEIYEIAGQAADQLGLAGDALRYRKLAFRLDPANHAAAISVLERHRVAGESDFEENWLREVLDQLEASGTTASARALADWAISRREGEALGRALVVLVRGDMVLLPTLIEETVRAGMEFVLVSITATIMALPNLTDKVRRAVQQRASGWGQQAEQLKAAGEAHQALVYAKACLSALPGNGPAVRTRRALAAELLARLRAAPGDAAVVALCEQAGEAVFELAASGQAYARALVNLERLADAQAVATRVMVTAPGSIDARANLAHIAGLNGDFLTALQLYIGLAAEAGQIAAHHQVRIERFLAAAGTRGVRQIRALLAERRNAEALAIWQLLSRREGLEEVMATEAMRIRSALRGQLRQLDDEEDDRSNAGGLLAILDHLLSLAPEDATILRRAALAAMKQQEFEKAVEYWQRLDSLAPGLQEIAVYLERCTVRARRQARHRSAAHAEPLLAA
jgi:tetratricopeptide (TPR) repeat protein